VDLIHGFGDEGGEALELRGVARGGGGGGGGRGGGGRVGLRGRLKGLGWASGSREIS
jgi:hypothetical protein